MQSSPLAQDIAPSAPHPRPTVGLSLRDLHLTDDEERVYRRLLPHASGIPAHDLAEHTGLAGDRLADAMARLEKRDLVDRRGVAGRVIFARPPEEAFADMLAAHERELTDARRRIDDLSRLYQSRSTLSADVVDVIVGHDSLTRHFHHMQRLARTQIRGCDRPPYLDLRDDIRPVQRDQLAAGVEYRILYDPVALSLPGGVARVRRATGQGEQVRLLTDLPVKLGIADDQLGMISLGQTDGEPSALLVHPSLLLESMTALFETLWRFSTPLRCWSEGDEQGFSDADRELLGLLAAGVTEETMARRLGIGLRTVQRRTQELMDSLGVATRFQAGVAAAKRGLL